MGKGECGKNRKEERENDRLKEGVEKASNFVIPRRAFRRGISLDFRRRKRKRDSSAKSAPRNDKS